MRWEEGGDTEEGGEEEKKEKRYERMRNSRKGTNETKI